MPYPSKQLEPERGPAEWFGAELRFHRMRNRLSQNALGEKVFVSGDTIRKIETAQRPCSPKLAQALDQELGTGGVLARARQLVKAQADKRARHADKTAVRILEVDGDQVLGEMLDLPMSTVSGESVNRRKLLAAGAGLVAGLSVPNATGWPITLTEQVDRIAATCVEMGRHNTIGRADLTRLTAVHDLYQSLDYQYGGGLVSESLNRVADSAASLLECRFQESLRPEVFHTVAKIRLLAGWTAFDMCDHSGGQRHFAAAERLAVTIGDPQLAGFVRYRQARQLQHLRCNRDAVEVLRLAQEHLGSKATPGAKAMLGATAATSLAALGDHATALEELERAAGAFDGIDFESEPSWLGWRSHAELFAQYGRVYRDLARQDRAYSDLAVEWTQRAIEGFDDGMQRSSLLNEVGLCSAWFLAGDPERALEIGTRLSEELGQIQSNRVKDRVANVARDASAWRGRSDVDDFVYAITTNDRRSAT